MTTNSIGASSAPPIGYTEAIALFKAGEFAQARDILRQSVKASPRHVGAVLGLGMCAVKLGDRHAAANLLQRVIELDPRHVAAHLELAELYETLGRREEALAAYRTVLSIQPGNPTAARRIAALQPHNGHPPQPQRPDKAARKRSTLATELDDDAALTASQIAGDIVVPLQRRGLWSHRRLWLGIAMLVYVPLGVLSRRRAEQLMTEGMAQIPGAPPGVSMPPMPTDGQIFLALFISLLELFGYALLVAGVALLIGAVLSSRMSTYVIRQHRIEITKGVLFRSRRYVWLYGLRDLEFVQDPLLILAGTAKIKLVQEDTGTSPMNLKRAPKIIGCGSTAAMQKLYDRLESMTRTERRAMKKAFI